MEGNESLDTAAITAISREASQAKWRFENWDDLFESWSRETGSEVRDGRESRIAALSGSLPKGADSAGGYLLRRPTRRLSRGEGPCAGLMRSPWQDRQQSWFFPAGERIEECDEIGFLALRQPERSYQL